MNSLFSTFDPSGIFHLNLNWLSCFSVLMLTCGFWAVSNIYSKFWSFLMNFIYVELSLIFPNKGRGEVHLYLSIFLFIFYMNFMGLFPYIFTPSSHLCTTFFLSIPLWLGSQMLFWFNDTNNMFAHLVPEGTPFGLMPLLVLIETVSNIIRPLTLSIRLMANMTAGHLLLSLLGGGSSIESISSILMVMFMLVFLIGLELGVSIIQSYVFTLLTALYVNEGESH